MSGYQALNPGFAAAVRASFERQGLMRALGITLARVEPGVCELRAPYSEALSQQHGYFHGALIAAVLDCAGGYAAYSLMPAGSEVLTTEYKVNFTAAAAGEELIAVGQVIRPGRTLTVTEGRAWCCEGEGRTLVAVMLQTLIRLPAGAAWTAPLRRPS